MRSFGLPGRFRSRAARSGAVLPFHGVVRLFLLWDSAAAERSGYWQAMTPNDVCVTFDQAAAWGDRGERHEIISVDDLLTWAEREEIQQRVLAHVEAIRNDERAMALKVLGFPILDSAEYQLRLEWKNVLASFVAAGKLRDRRPTAVAAQPECPSAVRLGAETALGIASSAHDRVWTPMYRVWQPGARNARIARTFFRARSTLSRPSRIRVIAMPNSQLTKALLALPPAGLKSAHLGVAAFPGLAHRGALSVATRTGLPTIHTAGRARGHVAPQPEIGAALGVDPDPALDEALKWVAERVLAQNAGVVVRAAAAAETLGAARNCKAILVATAAVPSARVLKTWAAARGIRLAVMQHAMYNGHQWDGGDRHADLVLGWSPGTADFISSWPTPRPQLVTVGTPSISSNGRHAPSSPIRRVLVATTHTSRGPALVPYAFCENFLATIAPGLRRLRQHGVDLKLRLHPTEHESRYRRLLSELDLRARVRCARPTVPRGRGVRPDGELRVVGGVRGCGHRAPGGALARRHPARYQANAPRAAAQRGPACLLLDGGRVRAPHGMRDWRSAAIPPRFLRADDAPRFLRAAIRSGPLR